MKILHDLVPCGICGVFNVKVLDLNGLWLCASCLATANELMNNVESTVDVSLYENECTLKYVGTVIADEVTTEWAC